jgi:hypothetical protein
MHRGDMPPSTPSSIGSPVSEARLNFSHPGRHIKPLPQRRSCSPRRQAPAVLDCGDDDPSLTHSAGSSQSTDENDILPTPPEYDLYVPVFPPPNSIETLVKAVASQTKLFGGIALFEQQQQQQRQRQQQQHHQQQQQDDDLGDDVASDYSPARDESPPSFQEPEIRFLADEIGRTNKKKRKVPGAMGSLSPQLFSSSTAASSAPLSATAGLTTFDDSLRAAIKNGMAASSYPSAAARDGPTADGTDIMARIIGRGSPFF